MRYATIRKIDIQNGPGVRVSLFTQGCPIQCEGCFNSDIWDFDGGKEWTTETKKHFLELCNKPQIAGISILGGEPLVEQNLEDLEDLLKTFKQRHPHKTVWLWTGFIFEALHISQLKVLNYVDVLVDGPWVMSLGDFSLKYRGSSNQRVLDVHKSLEQGKAVKKEI